MGWLLLDDRLELGAPDDEETSDRTVSRRIHLAGARPQVQRFVDACATSVVVTSAERGREGTLLRPGVATGELDETRNFNGVELTSDWTFVRSDKSTYTFRRHRRRRPARTTATRDIREFSPEVAAAFGRGLTEDVSMSVKPKVVTLSLYAANRRKWSISKPSSACASMPSTTEIDGNHTQVSPRLNLRYDFDARLAPVWLGRAFHAGTARRGVARRRSAAGARFRAGVYPHRSSGWSTTRPVACDSASRPTPSDGRPVAPYFDNQLDPFALLPDLTPDRMRVAAALLRSERTRAERAQTLLRFAHGLGNAGVGASGRRHFRRATCCAAGTSRCRSLRDWHGRDREPACRRWPDGTRGWPRTPFDLEPLQLHARNSRRMGRLLLARPARQLDLDVRQRRSVGGRGSDQCHQPRATSAAWSWKWKTHRRWKRRWITGCRRIINIGFTYRWRSRR